jgi:hypothetical protein
MPTAIGEELEKPEEIEIEPEPVSFADKLKELVWKTKVEEKQESGPIRESRIGKCVASYLPSFMLGKI